MSSSTIRHEIEELIPVLSEQEKQDLIAYHAVYEKQAREFNAMATEDLKDHPVFGSIIRDTPPEVSEANNKLSIALQKAAIMEGEWLPYIQHQIQQGITYAKMGLNFNAWYEVIALFRNYLIPYLHHEYGNGPGFLSALNGMNRFMDIAMGIIGEAYMEEKNGIINETNKRLSSIFETTSDMIFVLEVEPEGLYKFSSVNKSFQDTTGLTSDSVIGKYAHEIIPPDKKDFVIGQYKAAIEGKKTVRWEYTSLYPKGEVIGEVSITPLFDEAGICIRLLGTVHDITELKKTETELRRLNDVLEEKVKERTAQLESVNKEMESFTYSVSHDLRAPLRAINGYSEMLQEDYGDKLDDEGRRIINTISTNAKNMGKLIDDLLTFSRLGRTEVQMMSIEMNQLVESVMQEINGAFDHVAKVKVGNLHRVKADYAMLKQAVYNLISNAIKYSSRKRDPIVEISSEKQNGEVIFSVKDNGAGFNMKYADKLFGVFQRLHSTDEFEGSGVGLALVHQIISKHNGRVWAEGEVDKGAKFYFSLKNN